jgi:bacterioferritin-associated ferredoxin
VIVCHCHAVSDREIRRAAREGAATVRDVARDCHAASGCGGCSMSVREILDEVHGRAHARDAAPQPELALATG